MSEEDYVDGETVPDPPYVYAFRDLTVTIVWIERNGEIVTKEQRQCPDGAENHDSDEKALIELWLIGNVDETCVPNDEGNGDGLLYNLVHRLRGDCRRYNYESDQDDEIKAWLGPR